RVRSTPVSFGYALLDGSTEKRDDAEWMGVPGRLRGLFVISFNLAGNYVSIPNLFEAIIAIAVAATFVATLAFDRRVRKRSRSNTSDDVDPSNVSTPGILAVMGSLVALVL